MNDEQLLRWRNGGADASTRSLIDEVLEWRGDKRISPALCDLIRNKALDKAANEAKVFWLTYPFEHIADAAIVCGLCERIATTILALKTPESKP